MELELGKDRAKNARHIKEDGVMEATDDGAQSNRGLKILNCKRDGG